jgi:hypothetical protein
LRKPLAGPRPWPGCANCVIADCPRVGWQFTLAMAAYNLVRLPKLQVWRAAAVVWGLHQAVGRARPLRKRSGTHVLDRSCNHERAQRARLLGNRARPATRIDRPPNGATARNPPPDSLSHTYTGRTSCRGAARLPLRSIAGRSAKKPLARRIILYLGAARRRSMLYRITSELLDGLSTSCVSALLTERGQSRIGCITLNSPRSLGFLKYGAASGAATVFIALAVLQVK